MTWSAPRKERSSAGVSESLSFRFKNEEVSIRDCLRFTTSGPDMAMPCHSLFVRRQSIDSSILSLLAQSAGCAVINVRPIVPSAHKTTA